MACLEIIEWNSREHHGAIYLGQALDPVVGTILELAGNEVLVGRATSNDLVLRVSSVSRYHFRLFVENGRYVFENVRSNKFPVYNGKMFLDVKRVVEDGDTFNAGGIFFRYHHAS